MTNLTPQENEENSPLKIEFSSTSNNLDEEGDCNETDSTRIENETKKPRRIGKLRQSMMKRLTDKINFSHGSEV